MGTSAFDILNKGTPVSKVNVDSGTPDVSGVPVSTTPLDNTPKSAFSLIDPNKPVTPVYSNTIGNTASFIGSVLKKKGADIALGSMGIIPTLSKDYLSNINKGIDKVGQNIADTADSAYNSVHDFGEYVGRTPISQIPGGILGKIKDTFVDSIKGVTPGGLVSGLVQQMVEDPISAVTQLKNSDGIAVPMNSDELAQKFQSVAGTIAMGEIAKGVHAALLPTSFNSSAEAIAAAKVSKIGKMAKVVGTDALAGASGGAAQGLIANMGNPEEMAKSLAGALTFGLLGSALGLIKYNPYIRDLNVEKARLTNLDTKVSSSELSSMKDIRRYSPSNDLTDPTSVQELASLNALRSTSYTTIADIAHSIDAINTSDNILQAAIKSKLSTGKGFVIEGVNPESANIEFPNAVTYHSPLTNTLAVSPFKIDPLSETFFKKNGFLPYELVTHEGVEHYISDTPAKGIKIVDINNGNTKIVNPLDIRRTNTSPVTSFITALDGTAVDQMGVISSVSILQKLAKDFTVQFRDRANAGLSFDDNVSAFAAKNNIKPIDLPMLHAGIYKTLSESLANETLTPRERVTRKQVTSSLIESNLALKNTFNDLTNTSNSNGMYVRAEGGGRYSIRTLEDNTLIGYATSPEEALGIISKSNQVNGLPLDANGTGAIPTNASSNGSFNQTFNPVYSPAEKIVDFLKTTALGQKVVPVVRWFESIDNQTNARTSFLRPMLAIQDLQNKYKSYISNEAKPIIERQNALINMFKAIPENRHGLISDNAEAISPAEIQSNYLGRPMLPGELNVANQFKGVTTNDVIDLIQKGTEATKKKLGSNEFNAYLTATKGQIDPKVFNAAIALTNGVATSIPEVFSPLGILKLARALEDPASALSRTEHSALHKLSPLEQQASDGLKQIQDHAIQQATLDPSIRVNATLPDLHIQQALGFEGTNIDPVFAKDLARIAIIPEGTERNPLVQANRYIYSLIKSKSGFTAGLVEARKAFKTSMDALESDVDVNGNKTRMATLAPLIEKKFNEHINDVLGIANNDDMIAKTFTKLTKSLGIDAHASSALGLFTTKNAANLFSTAQLGFRLSMGVRDMHNVLGHAYRRYGSEFAAGAFGKALDTETMVDLQRKGVFPHQSNIDIVNPVGEADIFSKGSKLDNLAQTGFKFTGQEAVYNRSLAGIYLQTQSDVFKALRDLKTNILTKEETYKKLQLSAQSPTVQRIFDDFVQAGKPLEAADFLGKYRGRELSNIFGNNNNPQGWKSTFGRFMGQYGSYAANAMNTYVDNYTRGSLSDIAARGMREGIFYAATAAAGGASGLNLSSWQIADPWNNLVKVGPLANLSSDIGQEIQQRGWGAGVEKFGMDFIPGTRAYTEWKTAYEKSNPLGIFGKLEK